MAGKEKAHGQGLASAGTSGPAEGRKRTAPCHYISATGISSIRRPRTAPPCDSQNPVARKPQTLAALVDEDHSLVIYALRACQTRILSRHMSGEKTALSLPRALRLPSRLCAGILTLSHPFAENFLRLRKNSPAFAGSLWCFTRARRLRKRLNTAEFCDQHCKKLSTKIVQTCLASTCTRLRGNTS